MNTSNNFYWYIQILIHVWHNSPLRVLRLMHLQARFKLRHLINRKKSKPSYPIAIGSMQNLIFQFSIVIITKLTSNPPTNRKGKRLLSLYSFHFNASSIAAILLGLLMDYHKRSEGLDDGRDN